MKKEQEDVDSQKRQKHDKLTDASTTGLKIQNEWDRLTEALRFPSLVWFRRAVLTCPPKAKTPMIWAEGDETNVDTSGQGRQADVPRS